MFKIHAVEEAIWHFAGLFHLAEERGRLRSDYDKVSAQRVDDEHGPIEPMDIATGYPFAPGSFIPDIKYVPPSLPVEALSAETANSFSGPIVGPLSVGAAKMDFVQLLGNAPNAAPVIIPHAPPPPPIVVPPTVEWVPPPPGSVAAVIIQQNLLIDDDRLNVDDFGGPLVSAQQILAKLEALVDQSGLLGVALPLERPADEAAFVKMVEVFANAAAPQGLPDAATVSIKQGAEIAGKYVNGVAVDERPDIAALLPDYRQPDDEEDEPPALTDEQQNAGKSVGPSTVEGGQQPEGQHDLVVGNNTLVNQTSITAAWIAAPVFAVAGDVHSYTVVSQTNVWSDSDEVVGEYVASGGADPTLALNYSSYENFSNPLPDREGDGDQPQYWVTATVQGSLISVNWVEQYNIVSDSDIASVTLEAQQTMLIMGENGAINQVSLSELGMQYDLIVIDGQIINLNSVQQTNVMLDDDRIMVSGEGGALMRSGDNLLVNESTIVQAGHETVNAADGGYAQMLQTAANGEMFLPQSVLNDPAFQDLDVVRVLHIQGDLVSVNVVDQKNVLGDADQVELLVNDLLEQGATVQLVSGSNVLINSSTIVEIGVDSAIYVGGEVYSDALLHQAELVSTDDPLTAGASQLASEAVLFLADDMLGDDAGEVEFAPIGTGSAISADAMETVIS